MGEPERAKADSDTIFGDRFHLIFHEHYSIEELCRLFELYRLFEETRDNHVVQQRDAIEPTGERQYIVYGHWFVLYAAKLILSSEKMIPTGEEARALVLNALILVAKASASAKSTAQYQLFRSSNTKGRIIAELEGRQLSLFDL
jgi:hypothetical protein